MKAEFHMENELVRVVICGHVSGEHEGRRILDQLREQAIGCQPAVLWDAREATIQLGASAFCQFTRVFRRDMKSNLVQRRVAVLVNDPTAASLFLIVKTLMAKWPTQYRLFQYETDARAWLSSSSKETTPPCNPLAIPSR